MAEEKKLEELEPRELFDMDFMQRFQDSLARSGGMSVAIVSTNGSAVTRPTDWSGFTSKRPSGSKSSTVKSDGQGRVAFEAPVMLDGVQLGSVFGEMPGTERQAEEAAEAFALAIGELAKLGYMQFHLCHMYKTISDTINHVSASMQELAASARDVDSNQQQLSKGIQGVAEISDKIDDFTSLVRNIAKQTRLLGLNASIEAARAGAAGAGFAVVSDEIGKLANNSNDAVDKIQSFTGRIGEAVNDAVQKGERTADIVDQQSQAIEETAQHLTGLAETASALYDLAHNK